MDKSKGHELPAALAREMLDVMLYLRMGPEARVLLDRCDTRDSSFDAGGDVTLRLELLAIDEEVERAVMEEDVGDVPKGFERLLSRFDVLVGL